MNILSDRNVQMFVAGTALVLPSALGYYAYDTIQHGPEIYQRAVDANDSYAAAHQLGGKCLFDMRRAAYQDSTHLSVDEAFDVTVNAPRCPDIDFLAQDNLRKAVANEYDLKNYGEAPAIASILGLGIFVGGGFVVFSIQRHIKKPMRYLL